MPKNTAETLDGLRKVIKRVKNNTVFNDSGEAEETTVTDKKPPVSEEKAPIPNEKGPETAPEVKAEEKTAPEVKTEEKAPETAPETKTEEKGPEPSTDKKDGLSFFDDIEEKTEEDKDDKSRLEEKLDDLTDEEDLPSADEEMSLDQRKELAKIRAGIYVQVIDLIFMLLCMLITGDWTDKGQEKYSLVPKRQKAIKLSIYQLLLQSKRKPKPGRDLTWLILGSYAPMIIIALVQVFKRKKKEKEQRELDEKRNAAQMSHEQAAFILTNPGFFTPEQVAAAEALRNAPQTQQKEIVYFLNENTGQNSGGQGHGQQQTGQKTRKNSVARHAPDCAIHKKKKCNCGAV